MLICLDYDGVIVDSLDNLVALARRAHQATGLGREPSAEDFALIENLSFKDLAVRCGVAGHDLPGYADALFRLQAQDRQLPPLFAGMGALLETLAGQHTLVVVTASVEANVRRVLAAHGIGHTISAVLDGTGAADKAARISLARERFDDRNHRAWMVGDAVSDLRAGRAAGVRTVAVTWGYQPRARLLAEHPDHVADSVAELGALLASG